MAPDDAARELKGGRDETEFTSSNFISKDLIEIICILETGEQWHWYKITQKNILLSSLDYLPGMENRRH